MVWCILQRDVRALTFCQLVGFPFGYSEKPKGKRGPISILRQPPQFFSRLKASLYTLVGVLFISACRGYRLEFANLFLQTRGSSISIWLEV